MYLQHYLLYCILPQLFNSLKPSGGGLFTGHHIIIRRFLDCAGNEAVIVKVALKYSVYLIYCLSITNNTQMSKQQM